METIKTQQTEETIRDFIERFVEKPAQKEDAHFLVDFFEKITGFKAKMWGPSMIGFGSYHYKSDRSKQEGVWPLIAFSPRKAAISLYVYTGLESHAAMLDNLGIFKMGKACIYVKKVSDINLTILEDLTHFTIAYLKEKYPDS
jgi:hypothetical protein